MAENNEPLHPAVNPDLYANLDEQREGYAPVASQGWDVLTRNLTGESAPATRGRRQRPRGSVAERRWLRSRGLIL